MDSNKVDIFDPGIIIAFIFAIISDFFFIALVGLIIPGVGLAIGGLVILIHYICGLIVGGFFWHKTRGWFAKLLLGAGIALPTPTLALGIVLGIIFSNKLLAIIGEQIAIQAAAVITFGGAELAEIPAAVEAGVEATELAVEGAEALGTAAEVGEGAMEAGEAAGEAAEGLEEGEDATKKIKKVTDRLDNMNQGQNEDEDSQNAQEPEIEPEALGQERPFFGDQGQFEKDLLEEPPSANLPISMDEADRPEKNTKKIYDIGKHPNYQQNIDESDQEKERKAA